MLPGKNKDCRVGSTYNWKQIDEMPTEKGRLEIEEKLSQLYTRRTIVKNTKAGVRPATKDRRPFIGLHPKNEKIGMFNGFGSKGVSLTPYYARQFVEHLEYGLGLDKEVDINRYFN